MIATRAETQFAALPDTRREPPAEYNFAHFRTKHLIEDGQRTVQKWGPRPGEVAPDFTLPAVGGVTVTLADLRGEPVLLHFGSIT